LILFPRNLKKTPARSTFKNIPSLEYLLNINWGKRTLDMNHYKKEDQYIHHTSRFLAIPLELLPSRPAYLRYFARILTHLRFLCPNLHGSSPTEAVSGLGKKQ
jgi:hypothetical protein